MMFNFNDKSAYLAATNINHVLGYVGDVDFSKLKDANVLCAFSGGKFHTYGIAQSIKGDYGNHRGYYWSLLEEEYNV